MAKSIKKLLNDYELMSPTLSKSPLPNAHEKQAVWFVTPTEAAIDCKTVGD